MSNISDARRADLSQIDQRLIIRAGDAGGRYLDYINVTDMADLTEEQWTTFLREVIEEWNNCLPPF